MKPGGARRLVLLLCLLIASGKVLTGEPRLILVSIDGFRWDYLEKYRPGNLLRLASEGVRAHSLIPVFPSKTFPNHYTIVTGLFPNNHGIVSNTMVDRSTGKRFRLSDREAVADSEWWRGEPIWVTAEKQGVRTATMFWPGSEASIQGIRPTYWMSYDNEMPYEERVRQIFQWIDLPPDQRPQLMTLYFEAVDRSGHNFGPNSVETRDSVLHIDRHIGNLVAGLQDRALLDSVHIIIVSDHGMSELSSDRVIVLDDMFSDGKLNVVEWSPILGVNGDSIALARLGTYLSTLDNIQLLEPDESEKRFHYSGSPRVPMLLGLAEPGWTIATHKQIQSRKEPIGGGDHGYDPSAGDMHGILICRGPRFRSDAAVPSVHNVHLYALMCNLLGLEAAHNDGSADSVKLLLR